MTSLRIRPERPGDVPVIDAVTRAAFADVTYSDQTEHEIVARLRAAGALSHSLVAELGGRVVGHVAVSPVTVAGADRGWVGLGPLSVLPQCQRRGVGSALMRAALATLRIAGSGGCVLLGDPAYYARFGFGAAEPLVLADVPPAYFQALVLSGSRPAGAVRYHAAFDSPAG